MTTGPCSLSLPRMEAVTAVAQRPLPRLSPATLSHGDGRCSPSPFWFAVPQRLPRARETPDSAPRSPPHAAASPARARPARPVPRRRRITVAVPSRPLPALPLARRPPAAVRADTSPEEGDAPMRNGGGAPAPPRRRPRPQRNPPFAPLSAATRPRPSDSLRAAAPREAGRRPQASPPHSRP